MSLWNETRKKRDFINSEKRKKMMDENRKLSQENDDESDLETVAKEVHRIKTESSVKGVDRIEIDILSEMEVSEHEWKQPFPEYLYKAFDLITALAKE